MEKVRFIDLFCGIGGFRLGLERANQEGGSGEASTRQSLRPEWNSSLPTRRNKGKHSSFNEDFRCVWSNDNDRYACQIYRKHWGEVCEQDIRTVDTSTIPEHDLLCAGFPCQSFSIAGKRKGFGDTRGTLFFEICRVIRAKRPSYLLLENVKGLLSHDDGSTFETILRTLDDLGYDCQWQVLNSKDYGVPQNRERVFIVGHLRGKPRPKVFPIREADRVYTETDEQISHAIDSNYHKGWLDNQQRTMIAYSSSQRKTTVESRIKLGEANTLATQDGCASGMKSQTLVGQLVGDRDGRAWSETELHPSLQANPQGNIPVLNKIRRLTPLECERLQGFPDSWTEGISDTQRYKCLGNAVTVNVIETIGRQFLEGLDGEVSKGRL